MGQLFLPRKSTLEAYYVQTSQQGPQIYGARTKPKGDGEDQREWGTITAR